MLNWDPAHFSGPLLFGSWSKQDQVFFFLFQSSPSGEYLKNTKAKLPTHKIDTLMSISLSDLCEMKETHMEKSVSNKYVNLPT